MTDQEVVTRLKEKGLGEALDVHHRDIQQVESLRLRVALMSAKYSLEQLNRVLKEDFAD